MDLRIRRRSGLHLAALTASAIVLAACGGDSSVTITPPAPTGQAAAACEALDPHLPATVDGTGASTTTPDSPFTAAWGDIVLSCGGTAPTIEPTAQLLTIDEVDWYPESLPQGGTRFTTVQRVAPVAVTVPATRQPEADALVDLSGPVKQYVPQAATSD